MSRRSLDLYTDFPFQPLSGARQFRMEAEANGYSGIWATENRHDPFLPLAACADIDQGLTIGTGVVTALTHNAFNLAKSAWDLHFNSGEHFILGVCAHQDIHLEHRFGIKSAHKHRRLIDLISAIREIWSAWQEEREPFHESEQATIRTCPPGFRPTTSIVTTPPIYLLCASEQDVAMIDTVDGVFVHPLWTRDFIDRELSPALGAKPLISGAIIATGENDGQLQGSRRTARSRLAGYLLNEGYDRHFAGLGLTQEIKVFRALAGGTDVSRDERFWRRPECITLYNHFVCDAPFCDLPEKLHNQMSEATTGVFPNIMSQVPRILPKDTVAQIRGLDTQTISGPAPERSATEETKFAKADALIRKGRLQEAAVLYHALASKHCSPRALTGLSGALLELGEFASSLDAAERAVTKFASSAPGHHAKAKALLTMGNDRAALASYLQAAELRYNDLPAAPDNVMVPAHFALHNVEQLQHLSQQPASLGIKRKADARALANLADELACMINSRQEDPPWIKVRGQNRDILANPDYIRHDENAPERCLNPQLDIRAIEGEFRKDGTRVAVVDDFLTPDALNRMMRFCLRSTVWRHPYKFGYIGGFPEHGFVNATLLRLIVELRAALPHVLDGMIPSQWWCFAYDSELPGTDVHGDDADVTVNIWLTPDAANNDPTTGGLVVWDQSAPDHWSFDQMNGGGSAIREHLERTRAEQKTIRYRQNRAVIFDGHLFHETDRSNFKNGFGNRRRNLTILFRKTHGLSA